MEERIKNEDIVRHFKNEIDKFSPSAYFYKVIDTNARDTENYERVVIYRALYNSPDGFVKSSNLFVRKYDEFMSEVDHEKYPNVKQKYRFEKM